MMRNLLLSKKLGVFVIVLVELLIGTGNLSFGQAVGDYGTRYNTGTSTLWATGSNWVICTSAGTWTGATNASVAPTNTKNVWIRAGANYNVAATSTCLNLDIASTGSLSVGGNTFTVSGLTSVSGTFTITSNTSTKTFTGLVTINSGGSWTSTTATTVARVVFKGGITNNSTNIFDAGGATFNTNNQNLNGTGSFSFINATITGTNLTNYSNLTVSTALAGTGTLTISATGTLNIGGTCSTTTLTNNGSITSSGSGAISSTITNNLTFNMDGTGTVTAFTNSTSGVLIISNLTVPTFTALTASAVGNTVNYDGIGAQTLKVVAYSNLILSGSGAKTIGTLANGTLASGILNIDQSGGAVTASVSFANIGVNALQFSGVPQVSGTWGSLNATSASYKTNTWFTTGITGNLNVSSGSNPLDHFLMTTPATQVAGTAFAITTITAQDVNNNTVVSYSGTVDLTETGGGAGGAVSPATSGAFTAGVLSGQSVTLTKAGTGVTITALDHGGTKTGASGTFSVNVGAANATQSTLNPTSASLTANGTSTQVLTVQSKDANGNNLTVGGSTVAIIKSSGTGTISSVTDNGNGTYTATVTSPTLTGSGVFVATLGGSAIKSGTGSQTQSAITYVPGILDHFTISTISSPQTAETAITGITITAQDINNNTVTSFTSTVAYSGTAGITGTSSAFTAGQLTGVNVTPTSVGTGKTFIITGSGKTGTATFDVNASVDPTTRRFRTKQSGNWSNITIWESSDNNGTTWTDASVSPSSSNGEITVRSSHNVTVTASVSIDQTTIESGGQITVNSGQTLTIDNGTGTDLVVNGTMISSGTITPTGTLIFNSGGTYEHRLNGGTLPTAAWDVNSTCYITGCTSTFPTNMGQIFGNVIWNCSGQTIWGGSFSQTGMQIKGNLSMQASGSVDIGFCNTNQDLSIGGNLTISGGIYRVSYLNNTNLNVAGDIIISGGTLSLNTSTTANYVGTVNVIGSLSISGGTLNLSSGSNSSNNGILNVKGDFSHTAGTITESGSAAGCAIIFNGTGIQTYTSGGILSALVSFTVNSGAYLQMGTGAAPSVISNGSSGTFILSSGATLGITSPLGITTSGTNGNIQITGTRNFNVGANYIYNGTSSQVSGNGLPVTVNNLTIDNAAGVTLSATSTITNNLSITSGSKANLGNLTHNAGTLTLGGNATASGSWGSTSSTATHQDNTYFAATTGIVNVTSGSCITGTWLGTTSTDWNTDSNWCGGIPTASTDVLIPSGGNQPVIGAAGGLCRNITINNGASLSISGSNTLTVSGNWINNGTFTPNTSSVIYNGSSQTIGSVEYYNLTLLGSGTKTLQTGTKNIGGNFTIDDVSTNAVTDLVIGGDVILNRNFSFAGGSYTLDVAGNWTKDGWGTYYPETGTINFTGNNSAINGSHSDQQTFNNLTISKSGGQTLSLSGSLTTLNISGNLTLSSGAFAQGAISVVVSGNLVTNGGTITVATSAITMNGSGKTIGGSESTAFYNLIINNNAGGILLSKDQFVNGTLTMSNGYLYLNAYNLTLGASSSAVSGSFYGQNMIIAVGTGELRKVFIANGAYTFPVGDGTTVTPMTLNFTQGTYGAGAYVGVRETHAKHPQNSSINYLNRYWSISQSGISSFLCNVVGAYAYADLVGAENLQTAVEYTGSLPWQNYSGLSGNTLTANGVSTFGDFTGMGIPTLNTSVATLDGFTYIHYYGPSSYQQFYVTAQNLSNNIFVTAPTDFEVSNGGAYQSVISLIPSGGSVNSTINIRLKAGLAVGNYSNENIICSTTGLSPINVLLTNATVTSPTDYCSPTGDNSGYSITLVKFGTINNITAKPAGYNDYTASQSTNLVIGNTYQLTVNVNTNGNNTVGAKVWIDWNNGGFTWNSGYQTYDLGTIANTSDGKTANCPLSITVPVGASIGSLRMRVACLYYSSPYNACDNNSEVEDYSLNITDQVVSSISTGIITGSQFCVGATISVPYSISGTYTSGNIFTAQLSDASGSFSSPVSIGTVTSTADGTISATIPSSTSAGSAYRVRVVSSNPAITGSDNGSNLTINTIPSAPTTTDASICIGSTATLSASGAIASQFYKWYDSNSGGNLLKSSTDNNDNTYTTAVLGATTNFWVSILSAGGCESSRTQITATYPATSPDSQTTSGMISWIGHVYDGSNQGVAYDGSFTNYFGNYNEPETFDQQFGGGDFYCFDINSSLGSRQIYTTDFSVRYRMNTSKRGLYTVDLGSDDGSRLSVDGTLLYNNWNGQGFSDRPSILMNLNGNSFLVYDYFENGGLNRVVFQNLTQVLANNLTDNTTQSICLGASGTAISGDVFGTLPAGITLSDTGYQWTYSTTPAGGRTNISGASGATFTPNSSLDPFNAVGTYYVYRNAMLSSTNNVAPNPYVATNESNAATITVNTASATPAVSIAANPIGAICAGTSVTFTATESNIGGGEVNYVFKVNGIIQQDGASNTFASTMLANDNAVVCEITITGGTCLASTTASSNTVTMTVNPNLIPTVSIAASANPVCSGTSVTFTATPTNGGATPAYQWKLNSVNVGTNSAIYTNTLLANNDVVTCVMTSNATCVTGNPVTSNAVTMTVNPNLTVTVSISASANPVCSSTSVTFTATPTNGGTTPGYQWMKNGVNVGTNNTTYNDATLSDGDLITCVMTSNATCVTGNPATSNTVTTTVYSLIGNNTLDNINGNHGVICGTAAENANVVMTAPAGTVFTSVGFASYGTPTGTCPGPFVLGGCNALTSQSLTEGYLLGKNNVSIPASNGVFTDPCVGTLKNISVLAIYTEPVCVGSTPGVITGTSPTGGNGFYTYYWESSTSSSSSGFAAAPGTNNQQNYTPGIMSQTTWYRRTVISGGCSDVSKVIMIKVTPVLANNTISSGQSICTGSTPSTLVGSTPTGGDGTFTYLWELSTTGSTSGFSTASGTSNSQNYSPSVLSQTTWFRRTVLSGGCDNTTTAVQITVNPLPNPSITGDTSPCNKTTGVIYSTQSNMSEYTWTISGGTIISGDGTKTITVSWITDGNQSLGVSYKNTNGCLGSITTSITVHPLPVVGDFY